MGKLFEAGASRSPVGLMRGRTLNHSFIILDEAQNTTPEQMKMFLTRIGFGTKAVITGDVTQIDLARGQRSGLVEVKEILKDVRGIAFTHFGAEDVVRHPLVARIVSAYEAHAQANPPAGRARINMTGAASCLDRAYARIPALRHRAAGCASGQRLHSSKRCCTLRFVDEAEGHRLNRDFRARITQPTFLLSTTVYLRLLTAMQTFPVRRPRDCRATSCCALQSYRLKRENRASPGGPLRASGGAWDAASAGL